MSMTGFWFRLERWALKKGYTELAKKFHDKAYGRGWFLK